MPVVRARRQGAQTRILFARDRTKPTPWVAGAGASLIAAVKAARAAERVAHAELLTALAGVAHLPDEIRWLARREIRRARAGAPCADAKELRRRRNVRYRRRRGAARQKAQ